MWPVVGSVTLIFGGLEGAGKKMDPLDVPHVFLLFFPGRERISLNQALVDKVELPLPKTQ